MAMQNHTIQVIISGRVQGVWFRAWTAREATALGLDGWVRNRMDGTVEAAFSGDRQSVEEILRRCHAGPRAARVGKVTEVAVAEPVRPGFHQLPTL
jgi:acylphosphatase